MEDSPVVHSTDPIALPAASYDFQQLGAQIDHAHTLKTERGHGDAIQRALKPLVETTATSGEGLALPEGTVAKKIETDAGETIMVAVAIPATEQDVAG